MILHHILFISFHVCICYQDKILFEFLFCIFHVLIFDFHIRYLDLNLTCISHYLLWFSCTLENALFSWKFGHPKLFNKINNICNPCSKVKWLLNFHIWCYDCNTSWFLMMSWQKSQRKFSSLNQNYCWPMPMFLNTIGKFS